MVFYRTKWVQTDGSRAGSPYFYFASSTPRIRNTMFRASVRII